MSARKLPCSSFVPLVITAVLFLLILAIPADTASGQTNSVDTEALQKCVRDEKKLDLLFLVDVSASLWRLDNRPGSDPEALRVQALRAITQLLGTTSGLDAGNQTNEREINLAFLDFGEQVRYSFKNLPGWQPLQNVLDADSENKLFDQYKWKKTDLDTDYVRAIDPSIFSTKKIPEGEIGVLQVLESSTSPCRALLWFTDGKFDIDKKRHFVPWTQSEIVDGRQQAQVTVRSGREYLCTRDPRHGTALVDVLRASKLNATSPDLFVGAIGLGKKEEDFDLLRRIAEGSNSCGSTPASGQFVRASNPQDLLDALSKILLNPPTPQPTECGKSPRESERFNLGQALQKVSLVVSGNLAGTDVSLVGPSSKKIPLFNKGRKTGAGTDFDGIRILEVRDLFTVSNIRYLMVTAELNPNISGWSGEWGVEFCRSNQEVAASDKISVYVYGSLDLVVPNDQLTVGRTKKIVLQIVGKGAKTYSDSTENLRFKNLSVSVDGKKFDTEVDESGIITIDYSPSSSQIGKSVEVLVSTEPTFVIANEREITLDFPSWKRELPVRAVPKTPYIEQTSVWNNLSVNNRERTADFLVHPGDESGRLCITFPPEVRLADRVGVKESQPIVLKQIPKIDCFNLEKSSDIQSFQLVLAAQDETTYRIETDSVLEFPIEYKATTESGESENGELSQRITIISSGGVDYNLVTTFFMTLGSMLLPLLILYGFNFLVASRLIVPDRFYTLKVRLTASGAQEITESGALREFKYDADRARTNRFGRRIKSLKIENLTIKGRLSLSPFGAPYSIATHEPDVVIGPRGQSKARESIYPVESAGKAPISLANCWFLVIDSKGIDVSKADALVYFFAENHRLLEKSITDTLKDVRDYTEFPLGEIRSSKVFKSQQDNAKTATGLDQLTGSGSGPIKNPPTVSDGEIVNGPKAPTLDGSSIVESTTKSSGGFLSIFRRKSMKDLDGTTNVVPRDNGKSNGGDSKSPPRL